MSISRSVTRGGIRRGAGRPKKDPEDRVKLLGIYVTDEQRARYQDAAGAEGQDLPDWIRKHLEAAADRALRK
jgi:hypothetical protein